MATSKANSRVVEIIALLVPDPTEGIANLKGEKGEYEQRVH